MVIHLHGLPAQFVVKLDGGDGGGRLLVLAALASLLKKRISHKNIF